MGGWIFKSGFLVFAGSLVIAGCGPSEQQQKASADETRVHCLDNFCRGDIVPTFDSANEFAFKVNGQMFIGPRKDGGYGGAFAFYWPSRTPANQTNAAKVAPELLLSPAGTISNTYEVEVEVFLRSNQRPAPGPSRYQALQIAANEGRVLDRGELRPGLEVWRVKDVNRGMPVALWYVATGLRDAEGDPPVLGCAERDPKSDRCTMAFRWRPGISVDLRFRAKNAKDWPQIYEEVVRILGLVKAV